MMKTKGDKVARKKNYPIRYTDNTDHNVVSTVAITDVDLVAREDYIVEMHSLHGKNGKKKVAEFETTVSQSGEVISIPKSVITSTDEIVPGRTVNFTFYEISKEQEEDKEDLKEKHSGLIGVGKALADCNNTDGCDSRLKSKTVARYINQNDVGRVKFKNRRNGHSVVDFTHADYASNGSRFKFPYKTRREIGVEPGDMVEIYPAEENGPDVEADTSEQIDAEKINELYEMVSELHTAYLEAKND